MRSILLFLGSIPLATFSQTPPTLGTTAVPELVGKYLTSSLVLATSSRIYFGTGNDVAAPPPSFPVGSFWAFDPATNSWSTVPNGPSASTSTGACGFVLNSKLYVRPGGATNISVFDPALNSWTQVGTSGFPFVQTSFQGFSVGSKGYCMQMGPTPALAEFDPATNAWTFLAGLPTEFGSASVIGVGAYAYACLPGNASNFRRYDPATNTWSDLAAIPDAQAAGPLYTVNNKIYARSTVVWEYNIATNAWVQKAALPDGIGTTYAASVGTKGYLLTSRACGNAIEVMEHDVASDTWAERKPLKGPMGRANASSLVINGKAYVGGGGNQFGTVNDWWEFDPANTYWTRKGRRQGTGVGVALGAFGYFLNGVALWRYQPATDAWLRLADYPGPAAIVGFELGGKLYFGGPTLWQYDPATNQWTQRQSCPGAAPNFAWSLGTKGYFGGCTSGNTALWEYDAGTNGWTQRAAYPGSAISSATAFSITHRGYVGRDPVNKRFWFYEQLNNTWYPSFYPHGQTDLYSLSGYTAFALGNTIVGGLGLRTLELSFYEDAFSTFDGTPIDCAGVLDGVSLPGSSCNDNDPNTGSDTWSASCVCVGTPIVVRVAAKALLEGCSVVGSSNMTDQLRAAGLVPISEPYTALGYSFNGGGGESTTVPVLTSTGTNAIVGWVVLELRNAAAPSQRLASRAALLQRDGDVVDLDGSSPVAFNIANGSYYVAIRHRNHLGCMTSTPVSLSSTAASINFTSAALGTFGTNARKASGDVMLLWAGDVNFNGTLSYTGSGNDRDLILVAIGGTNPNGSVIGYRREDVNMDGIVRYTGTGNDRDPILVNVGSTTPNAIRQHQLP